jgi:hypothetical protein
VIYFASPVLEKRMAYFEPDSLFPPIFPPNGSREDREAGEGDIGRQEAGRAAVEKED